MVFEVRRFFKSEPFVMGSGEILDIYIHKKGKTKVGIKAREPKPKDYGWKIKSLDCKIITEMNGKVERWKKFKVNFQFKLKPKETDILETFNILNKMICEVFLQHEEIKEWKEVHEWCEAPIDELFVVSKKKTKITGKEKAKLKVDRILKPKKMYFESECMEGDNPEKLQLALQNWKSENISYPTFFDSLL